MANGGHIKKDSSKSRGYCGYHQTWDGRSVYLRSLREYYVACMLDGQKKNYDVECKTYEINGIKYRPDFFIFEDGHIREILEVKYDNDYRMHDYYIEQFKDYFTSVGIQYKVIIKYPKSIMKYCTKEMQESWIEKCKDNNSSSVRGELNPMFGQKHSEDTKKLIGEKAKARFADPEYKSNQVEKMKQFYNTPEGLLMKRRLADVRKAEAAARKKEYDMLPDVSVPCKVCGNIITSKEGTDICAGDCKRIWGKNNVNGYGKKGDKIAMAYNRYSTYLDTVATHYSITREVLIDNLEQYIYNAKQEQVIPKHLGLSRKTLVKYNIIKE